MQRKNWLAKEIWAQIDDIRYYNKNGKREMIARNTAALKVISTCSLILTSVFIMVSLIFDVWEVTWHFWLLFVLFAVTSLFSILPNKREKRSYLATQFIDALFHIILAVLLINLGVFYSDERPSSLLSVFLIVLPIFFTSQTWIVAAISIVSGTVFCILAPIYKAPDIASYDLFSTVLSMVLSLVVLAYFARLRSKEFIARDRYRKLSRTDLLTGVLNKRSYETWCQKLLDERENSEPCALAIFDLDNFKQINDSFGHLMGDKVLEIVGEILSTNFRLDGLVGRIGGDEFSAFACTRGGCDMFDRRTENVLAEVKERSKKELKINVTVSSGITIKNSDSLDYMEMYFDADTAMYDFKSSSPNERRTATV